MGALKFMILLIFCASGLFAQGTLTIETEKLEPAVVGVPYTSSPLKVSGGTAPYTWSINGAAQSPWVTLQKAGGETVLTGMPEKPPVLFWGYPALLTVTLAVTDSSSPPGSMVAAVYLSISEGLVFGFDELPTPVVDQPYSVSINPIGGVEPYTISVTSTLPQWLTFSGSTLSGTPPEVTTGDAVSINVTDSSSPPKVIQAKFGLAVKNKISVFNIATLSGFEGKLPSSETVANITGGLAPYTIDATGLPAGLSLWTVLPGTKFPGGGTSLPLGVWTLNVGGVLDPGSGLPVPYVVTYTVTDSANPPQTVTFEAEFIVYGKLDLPSAITFDGMVTGEDFETGVYTFDSGGWAPFTLTPGGMPGGVTLVQDDGANFHFEGVIAKDAAFTLAVEDSSNPHQTGSLTIILDAADKLSILTGTLPPAIVGEAYDVALAINGGMAPYALEAQGLPEDIELGEDAGQWKLTGSASDAAIGVYALSLTVTDSGAGIVQTVHTKIALMVNKPGDGSPLFLSTTFLPVGTTDEQYAATVEASGGVAPYEWSVVGLPLGIETYVEDDRLILTGTPEIATPIAHVEIVVRDADDPQQAASAIYPLVIKTSESAAQSDLAFTSGNALMNAAAAAGCSMSGGSSGGIAMTLLAFIVAAACLYERGRKPRSAPIHRGGSLWKLSPRPGSVRSTLPDRPRALKRDRSSCESTCMKAAQFLTAMVGVAAFALASGASYGFDFPSDRLLAEHILAAGDSTGGSGGASKGTGDGKGSDTGGGKDSGSGGGKSSGGGGGYGAPAQGTSKSEEPLDPLLFRSANSDGADAPTGRGILRMPSSDGSGNNAPPTEGSEPPVEPSEPEIEGGVDDPPFFDEPIEGKAVFIIDMSLSMKVTDVGGGEDYDGNVVGSLTRLMLVKTELINFLKTIDDNFWFDIVWLAGTSEGQGGSAGDHFGGYSQSPNTDVWQGELVQCTDDIRQAAIEEVKNKGTWPLTPTWKALWRGCQEYPDDLDIMVLLTDGAPIPAGAGEWGSSNHMQAILNDFPGWFAPKKAGGCKLIGIHVGQNASAGSFMQDFCAQNDGKYIHK